MFMKHFGCTAVFFGYLFSHVPAIATEHGTLQVLLQGSSTAELVAVVENAGGAVTHDLHLINAVGAKLSRAQLNAVLKSPVVSRHIDDLSDTTRPEDDPKNEDSCKVRGHIELGIMPETILWPLYNKRATTAWMESLEISWPATLGVVTSIVIGTTEVDPALYSETKSGSLQIDFPDSARPEVKDRADLRVSFQLPPQDSVRPLPRQRDFSLKASFSGGCSTDLVPGYENNHENYYYNEVAGVDALHLQGVTGKGITVAVLDSGLWEHSSIVNDTSGGARLLARYDALNDEVDTQVTDESGHGTHMTSIIANSEPTTREGRPTGSYKGVAPDANLVAVKVLDREGLAHVLEIVRAVQWVVDNHEKYNIRVLNLSFAQTPRWRYWEDPVNQAVMRAWASGIAVVAAAGNEGPEQETIGSPGNLPYIITVGAVTDSWTPDTRDDDYVPDFSSNGPTPSGHVKPDIVGLGGHMTGLISPESSLAREQPEDVLRTGEFVSTGSSQASAFVSGVLALLLQLEPDLSPDDLKCKLTSSAELAINRDGKLSYSPFRQGAGYVTATRAVTLGQRGCGNPGLDIHAEMEDRQHFLGPAIVGEDGTATLPGLDELVSQAPTEDGLSQNRKWGVKAHVERLDIETASDDVYAEQPFDWLDLYLQEQSTFQKLSQKPPRSGPASTSGP
jgi:serine protease AprX